MKESSFNEYDDSLLNNNEEDTTFSTLDFSMTLPYSDIKKRTDKSIFIKLEILVSPFNVEKYPVDYMWLPLSQIQLDETTKQIRIAPWLIRRKVDEQCSIIAEKLKNKEHAK
ncbi:MAG: hypothetical protein EOL97_12615 [Spirochaetia bacterium]|nr:hypothetical protein [Spirochaetia bacterium]